MITLYYHRGACSTSNHFALEEAGVAYEAIEVDLAVQDDPLAIKVRTLNPMAQTPVLVLDDGQVLTQNAVTLSFIADLAPHLSLMPERGTIERTEAESWLAFIASDLHPTLIEYGYASLSDIEAEQTKARRFHQDRTDRRLRVLEDRLASRDYILGKQYSVLDGYALIVLNWTAPAKIPLEAYPNILTYMARVEARPVIQRVRAIEGPVVW